MPATPHKKRLVLPRWVLALDLQNEPGEVYGVFREVLEVLPMSRTELARQLGVSQPTISRWASGTATPSLEDMARVVRIVGARTREILECAERSERILSLVQEADDLTKKRDSSVDRKTRLKYLRQIGQINEELHPLIGRPDRA